MDEYYEELIASLLGNDGKPVIERLRALSPGDIQGIHEYLNAKENKTKADTRLARERAVRLEAGILEEFSDLAGCTLANLDLIGKEEMVFTLTSGSKYALRHHQDCCEDVYLADIVGNLDDLVGSPILLAEVAIKPHTDDDDECEQWTFYKLATIKGYVTLRWYGTSNGYYSVDVSFDRIND